MDSKICYWDGKWKIENYLCNGGPPIVLREKDKMFMCYFAKYVSKSEGTGVCAWKGWGGRKTLLFYFECFKSIWMCLSCAYIFYVFYEKKLKMTFE